MRRLLPADEERRNAVGGIEFWVFLLCCSAQLEGPSRALLGLGPHRLASLLLVIVVGVGENFHVEITKVETIKHLLGCGVDGNSIDVDLRFLGKIVKSALSLFLLEFQGDTTDRTFLNSTHKMRGESSNLVTDSLGRKDGHLLDDLLVGIKVQSQLPVVLLDDLARGPLDKVSAHTTHDPSILFCCLTLHETNLSSMRTKP